MIISEKILKWVMCFYPPLLFQRIWVRKFHNGFHGADVKINKSLLNTNYNGSIFGGTIYAATDPFYAILFDQLLQRKGYKVRVWLKSASIEYIKPGRSALYFSIFINEEMLNDAIETLKNNEKFIRTYPVILTDSNGEVCARAMNEVYIRNKHKGEHGDIAY